MSTEELEAYAQSGDDLPERSRATVGALQGCDLRAAARLNDSQLGSDKHLSGFFPVR